MKFLAVFFAFCILSVTFVSTLPIAHPYLFEDGCTLAIAGAVVGAFEYWVVFLLARGLIDRVFDRLGQREVEKLGIERVRIKEGLLAPPVLPKRERRQPAVAKGDAKAVV
jgi:hypothetical protein